MAVGIFGHTQQGMVITVRTAVAFTANATVATCKQSFPVGDCLNFYHIQFSMKTTFKEFMLAV